MLDRTSFTEQEAADVAARIGIDFAEVPFDLDQFRRGLDVELEHGAHETGDDAITTGKIAWAHLKELPDYYDRLEEMERDTGSA